MELPPLPDDERKNKSENERYWVSAQDFVLYALVSVNAGSVGGLFSLSSVIGLAIWDRAGHGGKSVPRAALGAIKLFLCCFALL